MTILYIITGQKRLFWTVYINVTQLYYKILIVMFKRSIYLSKYYYKHFGFIRMLLMIRGHILFNYIKMPFKYYISIESFVLRNVLMILGLFYISNNFDLYFNYIKYELVNRFPDPTEIIYQDGYIPYAIVLSFILIIGSQLFCIIISKYIREILKIYWDKIIVLNLVNIFILFTMYCSVAHIWIFNIWWMPDNYKQIEDLGQWEQQEWYIKEIYHQIIDTCIDYMSTLIIIIYKGLGI